jgi:putative pyruvate formate lyase activating enzyme
MTCLEPVAMKPGVEARAAIARERAQTARRLLASCHFCAHHCGVDRLAGERGFCHAGAETRCFSAQVEVTDELEIIPTFAVALGGCDLRCDFCITGASSWNPAAGAGFDVRAVAARAKRALEGGARTVMLLGGEPTIHLPAALEFVAELPAATRLVWKTNAHGSAEARELLDGMFDIWVADYKFGNAACAQRLAGIPDYIRTVQENLLWADRQGELIVRHLLMPGHFDCCWKPIAAWLAAELPHVKVSLRAGFWPAWHADRHPELRETVSTEASRAALGVARALGLTLSALAEERL